MSLIEKLKSVFEYLASSLNLSFLFSEQAEANLLADYTDFPVLVVSVVNFTDTTNVFGTSNITFIVRCEILSKSNLSDLYAQERLQSFAFAETKIKSLLFQLKHLRNNDNELIIKQLTNVRGEFVKNRYDANADGVRVDLSIVLKDEQTEICPLKITTL